MDSVGFAGRFGIRKWPTAGLKVASKKFMFAGKRCGPTLIYLFIAIIVATLAFLALSHGPQRQPPAPPIHQKQ